MEDAKKIIKTAKPNYKAVNTWITAIIVAVVVVLGCMILAIAMGSAAEEYKSNSLSAYIYSESIATYEALSVTAWIVFVIMILVTAVIVVVYLMSKKNTDKMSFTFYDDTVKAVIYDREKKGLVTKVWQYSEIKSVMVAGKYGVTVIVDKPYLLQVDDIDGVYALLKEKTK